MGQEAVCACVHFVAGVQHEVSGFFVISPVGDWFGLGPTGNGIG